MLTVTPLTLTQAQEICNWRYPEPFSIYNHPNWETVVAQGWGIADASTRELEFRAVVDESGAVAGYLRPRRCSDCFMAGVGLHPCRCGKGLGSRLMELLLSWWQQQDQAVPLRLEVRTFNQRALRCYQKAGFVTLNTLERNTPIGPGSFYLMEHRPG